MYISSRLKLACWQVSCCDIGQSYFVAEPEKVFCMLFYFTLMFHSVPELFLQYIVHPS